MTKRAFQAAEYAAEMVENNRQWLAEFKARREQRDFERKIVEDYYRRRMPLSIRVHAAARRWAQYSWLRFLRH